MSKLLFCIYCICLNGFCINQIRGLVFFPRGGSFGYLAAVAIPLDLPNRNVYMAFNFEANYGLPSNDSYNEWIDRWNLDQNYLGIGNNITPINGRNGGAYDEKPVQSTRNNNTNSNRKLQKRALRYTRTRFYQSFMNYLELFGMNGTACLLKTICEVTAYRLDEYNGVLGSILKILFTPTASAPEQDIQLSAHSFTTKLYEAEEQGIRHDDCSKYATFCPQGIVDMVTISL